MDKEKDDKKDETLVGEVVTPAAEPSTDGGTEGEPAGENAEPAPAGTEPAPEGGNGERSRWESLADAYADDNNVQSEDEAYDVIRDKLEYLTEFRRNELAVNERLIDALNAEPDFRECVGYLLQGASFREALARTIDIDSLTPAEGEPDRAAWERAKEDRISRLKAMEEEDARNAERVKTIGTNTEATKALIEKFAQEHRMSDEEKRELYQRLADLAADILVMKISENVLKTVYNDMHMDEIIEQAKEDGAVGERNRKIEVMRMSKDDSDGLPSLDAGAGEIVEEKKDGLSGFFDDLFAKRGIK